MEWFDLTPISHNEAKRVYDLASKYLQLSIWDILLFRDLVYFPGKISVYQDVGYWPHPDAIYEIERSGPDNYRQWPLSYEL